MEKNTIWAISLSTVVLVGFFAAQTILFPPKPQEQQAQTEQTTEVVENQATGESEKQDSSIEENLSIVSEVSDSENLTEEKFTITTNKVAVTFTNRGGDIISYELIEKDDRGALKNRDVESS